MKWCQKHWDALRDGVKARGLEQFGAQDGREALENEVLALKGAGSAFDPLMGSHWQLRSEVLDNVAKSQGPGAALSCLGAPDWCPMCAIQESFDWWDDPAKNTIGSQRPPNAGDAQAWIDRKLDAAARYAAEQGFIGRA
jgi:hypothetical protein